MKILIVYAHPKTKGHCPKILEKTIEELVARNIPYEVLDLYKMNYDPILREDEHYTSGNRNISAENLSIQKKIIGSNHFIFIYPIWWGAMPAILKGFFDRIITPGFGYRYENVLPKKLLKGKKAIVIMTSGGPIWYSYLRGNRPKKNIKNDILEFCGIKTKVYQIGKCRKLDDEKISKLNKVVQKAVWHLVGKSFLL